MKSWLLYAGLAAGLAAPGWAQGQGTAPEPTAAPDVTETRTENGETITRAYAVAEFGEPLYDVREMEHWPYANPDAPKGGAIIEWAFGTYDTLNPYISQGQWPAGIGLIDDALMTGSGDELGVVYPMIAEYVEYPEDLSWATFKINENARFQDGEPIRADDFKFSFDTIREHGRPFLQSFYDEVENAEVVDDLHIRFNFRTTNSVKPLVAVAGLSPLATHYWTGEQDRDISATTLVPYVTSGGYRIASLDPGRSITYERIEDYWADDLPQNRGLGNFDRIRYDYYKDLDVAFEAFKAGQIDFWTENTSRRWATGYDIDPVRTGRIVKRVEPSEAPRGIQAFFYNTRLPQFDDPRERLALNYLYPFEWVQQNLMYGFYERINSYFPNSEYGAPSAPPEGRELEILEEFRGQVPEQVFTEAYAAPTSDPSGEIRANMRTALGLLREAGWEIQDGRLVNDQGQQFSLTVLLTSPSLEPHTQAWIRNLQQAGIDANIRIVDTSTYEELTKTFNFDVISTSYTFFPPPGPELISRFGCEARDVEDSANYIGICDPVIDALLERIVVETDKDEMLALTHALDRVLLWGHYVMPMWYNDEVWLAHWNRFGWPETKPRYAVGWPGTYWLDPDLAQQTGITRQ